MAELAAVFGDFDPKPTDRYFFALFPPADTRKVLEARQIELMRMHGLTGKPVPPDRLYMALCPLGDYVGENPDVVGRSVQAAAVLQSKTKPFEFTIDRAGSYSGRVRNLPFVLHGGGGAGPLEAFQLDLAAELQSVGLGKSVKPSTPHVTLLYDNQAIDEHPIPPTSWRVEEFVLVRSLLGRTTHVRLGSWRLGA